MDSKLLTKDYTSIKRKKEDNNSSFFIEFICKLEGWKTTCNNLHWAAPTRSIHIYLDDLLVVLSTYQDALAEGYMGILGQMNPNIIKSIPSNKMDALSFIDEVKDGTLKFYDNIPASTIYKGITSECETFIQQINKYKYLFDLCF